MKSKLHFLAALLFAVTMVALPTLAPAAATTATYTLTSDHCTNNCGPQSSFGSILVTDLGGGSLSFSVSLLNGNQFINTGFPLTLAFDLNGDPSITYSGLTSGFSIPDATGSTQTAGTYHMDGTGDFEYGVLVTAQGGPGVISGPLSFTISGSGLSLSSIQLNANNNYFAVDILSGTTGNTGLVDSSMAPVPEPETYGMLLAGLGLMGFIARRRRTTGEQKRK